MYRSINTITKDANLRFAWAEALPNAGSAVSKAGTDAAKLIYIGQNPGFVFVWAKTAITLAAAETLACELVAYGSNTPASAASPFQYGSLVHTITGAAETGTTIAAGTLLFAFAVDPALLEGKEYVGLKWTTSDDQSDDTVNAVFAPFATLN